MSDQKTFIQSNHALDKPKENGLAYRRDIDGLRAIAVLAVVFYHARLGITGGFVGVDIFWHNREFSG